MCREQVGLLAALKGKRLALGGDGRHDSMGHSAKFCSYTTLELHTNKILDIQLVQVGYNCNVSDSYIC